MNTLPETLQTLARSLPERFPFYHLGEIATESGGEPVPNSRTELANRSALGIRLLGDVRALLLVLVEDGMDLSLYSEVANLLASQLANRLAADDGIDIVISSPSPVSPARLATILRRDREAAIRRYTHRHGKVSVPVEAILLLDEGTGGGHA